MARRFRRIRWRQVLIAAGSLLLLVVIGLAIFIVHLDHTVTREFQGRHWSIPARIFGAPLELYVGSPVSASDLEDELKRVHYRKSDQASAPGTYRRQGNAFDLYARRVRFLDEQREPQQLSIHADAGGITGMQAGGADLPVFRLDPPVIGSVFPIHGEDRLVVAPAEIPPLLTKGIKLIEDRRFDEHPGVDLLGVLRATWANLRAGHVVQGGSTLTQQLVKNYFLNDAQTVGRKVTEALMAMRLESHYRKDEILVAYLNEVFLGQDGERAIHGFGLGSQFYFAKPLDELEPQELAMLIGLVKGPSFYDPRRHPDRALARRNLVLKVMADAKLLDDTTAQKAIAAPLGLRPPGGSYVPAYVDLVRRHLKRDYAEADLSAAGLSVYSALDPRAQAAAERAVTRDLQRLDSRAAQKGGHLQAAVIVAEPNSGDVVAVVGSRDVGTSGSFNRALDARRPIGSLVKPAVYLTAIESGRYTAASLVDDAPIELKLADGSTWAPQNFEHDFNGPVPLARALAESLNLATVKLGLDLGLPKVVETLKNLGLEGDPALNPSLLLGTVEMTPIEVTSMYTAIANGGFRARLRSVLAVIDEHGKALKSFRVQVDAAAPPAAAYQIERMLMLVPTHGTAREAAARLPKGLAVAGKTGTSSDTRDSWFAGFTGSYLAVAWVGYDDNKVTGLTGAQGALPVWADTMAALKPVSYAPVAPEQVEDRWIGFRDGLETNPSCSTDAVIIAVPKDLALPVKPGCSAGAAAATPAPTAPAATGPSTGEKIKQWLKNIVH